MKTVAVVLLLGSFAVAAKKDLTPVKVEIVSQSEERAVRYRNGGIVGAIQGTKTANVVFMVNAIIDGDHARLKCAEGHHGCTAIGPGVYPGEIKKDSVWITIKKPVTHELIRDHWKVAGTW